jgi:hypothetical protein
MRLTVSRPTRILLSGYALYVAATWSFGVAPGEIAFEAARVSTLPGAWERAQTIVRVDDSTLLIGSAPANDGPAAILVVDLDVLAAGEIEAAIVGRAEAAGWPRNAVRGATELRVLSEDESGERRAVVFDSASGAAVLEHFLAEQRFGLRVATAAAVISGELALVRIAGPGGVQDEHGVWVQVPGATVDDFALFDVTNLEPLGLFDTTTLTHVASFARPGGFSGFVYLEAGFPMVAWCEGSSCDTGMVRVRTDSHPIETIDVRSDVRRIALCTPSELYFYEGRPPDEDIVFLGRTERVGGCRAIAVVDDRRVLVVTAAGSELVEFIEEEPP